MPSVRYRTEVFAAGPNFTLCRARSGPQFRSPIGSKYLQRLTGIEAAMKIEKARGSLLSLILGDQGIEQCRGSAHGPSP
jgi:hypothetical protein